MSDRVSLRKTTEAGNAAQHGDMRPTAPEGAGQHGAGPAARAQSVPDDGPVSGREPGPLEAIYDEQLAPLVSQVIDICKANGIGLFLTACLDGDMRCTTAIPPQADAHADHLMVVDDCRLIARFRHIAMNPFRLVSLSVGGMAGLEEVDRRRAARLADMRVAFTAAEQAGGGHNNHSNDTATEGGDGRGA